MTWKRALGFETRKAQCKRAIRGDQDAQTELTVWLRELGDRAAIGDRLARKELEDLAYAVAYDFIEERIRLCFPSLRDRLSVSSGLHTAYLRLGNTSELFREPAAFTADLSSFCRRLCYMAHYALLDLVSRQRRWDRRHPQARGGVETTDDEPSDSPIDHVPADRSWDPVRLAEWSELHKRVEQLAPPLRDVFTRHYYLGLSQSEIANQTGMHPRQVSRIWFAAVAALGDVLDREE